MTYSEGPHQWDVKDLQLLAESLPIVNVPLSLIPEAQGFLESTCWTQEGPWVRPLTVREILDHANRVSTANLMKPVILTPEMKIADGAYQIVKCLQQGITNVRAVRLPFMPPPLSLFGGCHV